jgi:protein-export membrane protein SecD
MTIFPRWKIIAIIAVCLLGVFYSAPNFVGQKHLDNMPDWWQPVSLGLDLQGGSHLLLEVKTGVVVKERLSSLKDTVRTQLRSKRIRYDELSVEDNHVKVKILDFNDISSAMMLLSRIQKDYQAKQDGEYIKLSFTEPALIKLKNAAVEQSIEIVRRRVDELGTKEPTIQKQGAERIVVQLPGVQNPQRVKQLIGKTAKLTFHLVDSSTNVGDAKRGKLSPSSRLVRGAPGATEGLYVIKRRAVVGGEHLVDAKLSFQEGQPVVGFKFDTIGGKAFGKATRDNVNERLAIMLDNEIISAPNINGPIMGGSGIIQGGFTSQSANDLAMLLRSGALPAPLEVLEERTVGPGLGADSIKAGSVASVIGLLAVIIFMILAYGLFGLFTNFVLLVNMFLLLGGLSFLGATLTLPGIAGIVLTMGMAVDANVLIFERMREEVAIGRSPINAAEAGFKNAFVTIIDANITTLVAALVLFQFGTGPVRGFAVTLALGILTSLFTAVMVTRLVVSTWLRKTKPKTLPI